MENVDRILEIGDEQQFASVVRSRKQKNLDGTTINEFAESQMQPLILRAQKVGLRVSMLHECYRCTAGLRQPSSRLFHDGRVVNAPDTELKGRQKSSWPSILLRTPMIT